ncbi:MAG TPA: hypothetical protein VEW28_07605 [Candidatus Kapabacteria bacterium]|nr:hypothetical protein [Candidatus Kapabacteria bacterium]
MKRTTVLILALLCMAGMTRAQSGVRIFGAQQFQLDDNIAGDPKSYLSTLNGSLGIDNNGNVVPGIFPSVCAILDLSSTTRGFLAPRMTTAQELAICGGAPPLGLVVYNTTTNTLDLFGPFGWGAVGWALNGNNLNGGSSSTPNQFFGSNNNFDVVMKTNGIERIRLGSSSATNVMMMTVPSTAAVGLQINGNPAMSTGINVDMASSQLTGAGRGINANVTSNGGANATGLAVNSNITSGNGFSNGIVAIANNSSSGSGWITAIAGSTFAGANSTSNMTAGSYQALGGALSNQIVGVNATATGSNGGTVYGGGFTAGGSTALNIGVSAGALNANNGTNLGLSAIANNSASANTGIDVNATGTNSTGINFSAAPITGINLQASTSAMLIKGLASTTNGVNVDMSTTPVTVAGATNFKGTITSGNNPVTSGSFSAATTGGTGRATGVSSTATTGNANAAIGGSFTAVNGGGSAFGVTVTANGGGAGSNTGMDLVAANSTTSNTGIHVDVSGTSATGINITSAPTSISATGNIQTTGNNNTFGNNGATNNILVVNGSADATLASVAANPVWDSRINGDQLVTGIQKIGGSIWMDGTSATHQIVTDAPTNIGTKNGNSVSFITNNAVRQTIDASGNVTDQGNVSVNGTLTVGSGSSTVGHVIRLSFSYGSFTLGSTSAAITTVGPFSGVGDGDPVFVGVPNGVLSAGNFLSYTAWTDGSGVLHFRLYNADNSNSANIPASTIVFTIIK